VACLYVPPVLTAIIAWLIGDNKRHPPYGGSTDRLDSSSHLVPTDVQWSKRSERWLVMMGLGFGGMFLSWGLLLALLLGGAIWVSRLIAGTRVPVENVQPTARQILDERLARGEISAKEYALVRARIEQ
jgi:uncharacterized membrane protein